MLTADADGAQIAAKNCFSLYSYIGPCWLIEFDDIDICGRTADAQSPTVEELTRLVSRCEALKPRIEKCNELGREIILIRLQMCRELFRYVLESKEGGT